VRGYRGRKAAQPLGQSRDLLRNDVEPEGFDRDQAVALRIVRAKNGSENAAADLMQDAIRAEGGRRGETSGLVERQRKLPKKEDIETLARPHGAAGQPPQLGASRPPAARL
jgi:hypothetical protein